MNIKITNRQSLSAAIVIFYFLPIALLSFYSQEFLTSNESWKILSAGLLAAAIGTLCLMFFLYCWEQALSTYFQNLSSSDVDINFQRRVDAKVTHLDTRLSDEEGSLESYLENTTYREVNENDLIQKSLIESQEAYNALQEQVKNKNVEIESLSDVNKQLSNQLQKTTQDFADYKLFSEEQLKQKQLQFNSLQTVSEDQRNEMEKRQEQIHQLGMKVHDLSYEIKTLLCLQEKESEPSKKVLSIGITPEKSIQSTFKPIKESIITNVFGNGLNIKSSLEAENLLKKYIQIAEKMTGAYQVNSETSRYRDFSSTYYAIDQRRLFESLKNETAALIIVCTPVEYKLLFTNTYVKNLLGWSPEKFITDFPSIIEEGLHEWNRALAQLSVENKAQLRILAKTKQGSEIVLQGNFGVIPTGLFRHYAIGVFYCN